MNTLLKQSDVFEVGQIKTMTYVSEDEELWIRQLNEEKGKSRCALSFFLFIYIYVEFNS